MHTQASGGTFPCLDGGYIKWEDAIGSPKLVKRIKWGVLKNPTRAVEKMLRAYKGDPSKLLDLCRYV